MSKKIIDDKAEIKRKKNNKKKKRYGKYVGFLGFLFMISDSITRFFRKGFLGLIFADSYVKINEKWKSGFIYRLLRRENKRAHTHSPLISYYENSYTNSQVSLFSKRFIHSKMSIWGARMAFFSFAMAVVAGLNIYLVMIEKEISIWKYLETPDKYLNNLIVAGVIFLVSLTVTFSKREVGEAILAHKGTRFIVTNVLNLNANKFERGEKSTESSYFISMLTMFCFGLTTFFVSPIAMINIFLLFAALLFIMSFPEIGILMVLIFMPFATIFAHPNTFVISLVIFTICGFVSKFIRGKRVLKFEFIDVLMLALGILLMFGGIFGAGGANSFKMAEIYLAFLLMYFLIVNMYIRKPGIYRGIKIMVICGFLVALVALAYMLLTGGIFKFQWLSWNPVVLVLEKAKDMLVDRRAVGIYLVMIYPLALGQMLVTKSKFIKCLYLIAIGTIISSVMISGDVIVRWGIIIATVAFMLIYNFKSIWLVLGGALTFLGTMLVLPHNNVADIKNFFLIPATDIETKKTIWEKTIGIVFDNFFTGIGVGEESFLAVYYHDVPLENVPVTHSHNLFLQILVELGIVGFLIFVCVLFMFAQKCFVNTKSRNKRSRSRTMICAGYASILSACFMGFNLYIWSNYRAFLTFWIILALTVALTKVNDKENESERIVNNMISVDIEID
ncbi:MAG: O-antigen ligase family protein [Clostridia bacterium]|nr:O-antigen ligase family protein [Clostridia bacterium]